MMSRKFRWIAGVLFMAVLAVVVFAKGDNFPYDWGGKHWFGWQIDAVRGMKIGSTGYSINSDGTFYGLHKTVVVNYDTTTTAKTLTAADSGKTYYTTSASSDDTVTFNLPTAVAGLTFTFIDGNATAAADLWVTAGASDTIEGGTAAKSYVCTGDAIKQVVTLTAVTAVEWKVVNENGTWANDNN